MAKTKSKSSYAEKLKDPRWQKLRLQILERDDWKCVECGDANSTLHVHHGYYEAGKEPWEYAPGTLQTLCADCHETADWMRVEMAFFCAHFPGTNTNDIHNILRIVAMLRSSHYEDIDYLMASLNDLASEHEKAFDHPGYQPKLAVYGVPPQ